MTVRWRHWRRRHGRRVAVLLTLLLAGIVAVQVAVQIVSIRRQVIALATTSNDSTQWSIAQADVELLALRVALEDARRDPAQMDELRKRHGIFVNRIRQIATGPLYAELRADPAMAAILDQADRYLGASGAVLDLPAAALPAGLADLAAQTADLRPDIRQLSVKGNQLLAQLADSRRAVARGMLQRSILLAAFMALVVLALLGLILRLYWQGRQQQAEQARVVARLSTIVATSLDAILVVDATGTIIESNPAADALFGWGAGQGAGRRIADAIVWPADALSGDGPVPPPGAGLLRVTGRRSDGGEFIANCTLGTTVDTAGPRRVLFLHDISDRVAAEAAVVAARDAAVAGERAKADMLAVLSHETRTPLNGVLGTLDLLAETRLDPRQRDYLAIIHRSARQLLGLTDDVLLLARLEAGKQPLEHAVFDMDEMLGDLMASQRPAAIRHGNRLVLTNGAETGSRVAGDVARLRRILLNLIDNARRFTRDGTIELGVTRNGEEVTFTVADTGIGIASEDQARVFEEFFTVASAGNDAGGSGMGLAIVRRLVLAMGGQIALDSTPGVGSRFMVTLPLPPVAAGGPGDDRPVAQGDGRAVLVVEDNAINRFVLREMLVGDGHEVVEAVTGDEARKLAAARRFDLILMDIGLPGMDGVATARAIRRDGGASARTPVVALTAHATSDCCAAATAGEFAECLTKPLARATLRALFKRLGNGSVMLPLVAGIGSELVDEHRLDELAAGLAPADFQSLLDRFLTEAAGEVAGLTAATAEDDGLALAARAHRQAGSAALFGAVALHGALVALEQAARAGDGGRCRAAQVRLAAVWPATQVALRARDRPVPAGPDATSAVPVPAET